MPDNTNLYNEIGAYLASIDLGGLYQPGATSGWLWDQITSGVDSQSALQISLEQTQQFQSRYGVISRIRAQAQTGTPVHVPSVAEVREYENTVANTMRAANIPTFMYDNYQDLQSLMEKGLSAVEVEQRLGQTWERVTNTDPAVRNAYQQFFGIAGDSALAATYLDPSKTLNNLERMSRTAYTAGMGQKMGITVDQATADRVAASPSSDSGIIQELGQLGQVEKSGILNESLGERGTDLSNKTAEDATLFGSGQAQSDLERRALERSALSRNSAGGAVRTNQGLIGAGTANQ